MKRSRKPRIGYMALSDDGGGGGTAPMDQTIEQPLTTEEPIELYPRDPLLQTEEPVPDDVAVQLGQDIPAQTVPPQLSSYLAPAVVDSAPDPAAESKGMNWKLIIAIAVIGYLLMKKS